MNTIELESMCGKHELSGGYFDAINDGQERQVLRFTLDGRNLEAVECPEDGYRSSLECVRETDTPPLKTFPAVGVIGRMKEPGPEDDFILQFLHAETGAIIMEIGTASTNDYYPGFVAYFEPHSL